MTEKQKKQRFIGFAIGCLSIIILSTFMLFRGKTPKQDFQKMAGKVTYFDKKFNNLPNRHHGKYRYIAIENYPKVFEIFIGKEVGDFSPAFEKIDSIQLHDEIEIYFSTFASDLKSPINRLVRYIDKNGQPYFIYGSYDFYWGISGIIVGFVLLGFIYFLRKLKKI
jgi:hypothetical protein